jgi:hypothetical protein
VLVLTSYARNEHQIDDDDDNNDDDGYSGRGGDDPTQLHRGYHTNVSYAVTL